MAKRIQVGDVVRQVANALQRPSRADKRAGDAVHIHTSRAPNGTQFGGVEGFQERQQSRKKAVQVNPYHPHHAFTMDATAPALKTRELLQPLESSRRTEILESMFKAPEEPASTAPPTAPPAASAPLPAPINPALLESSVAPPAPVSTTGLSLPPAVSPEARMAAMAQLMQGGAPAHAPAPAAAVSPQSQLVHFHAPGLGDMSTRVQSAFRANDGRSLIVVWDPQRDFVSIPRPADGRMVANIDGLPDAMTITDPGVEFEFQGLRFRLFIVTNTQRIG